MRNATVRAIAAIAVVAAGWVCYDYVDPSGPEAPDFWAVSQGLDGVICLYVMDSGSCVARWDRMDTGDTARTKTVIHTTCDRDEADADAVEPDSIIAGGFWDRCIISGMQTGPMGGPRPPSLQLVLDCTA